MFVPNNLPLFLETHHIEATADTDTQTPKPMPPNEAIEISI